jgi:hypothetical protein
MGNNRKHTRGHGMKKPNLREQFEKETGEEPSYQPYMGRGGETFTTNYVKWLETINSEMTDALIMTEKFMKVHGWINTLEYKQIEQALKKAGAL